MTRPAARWLLAAGLVLGALATARAENWPQWRGPHNDGVSTETGLPTEWDTTRNVVWKLPLPGMAGSTPAVWGDRIFLTSEDGNDVVLICVGTDGREIWKRPFAAGKKQFRDNEGNQASPSPSTDGKHVYVYAGTGDLACFDFDGNTIWKFNVQSRYPRFNIWWGMHVTPLLYGDRLYLPLLYTGSQWVVALDKATGNEVWKVRRPSDARRESEQTYASPIIGRNGKDAYLIVHGCDYATAHRLEDGQEIWRVGGLNREPYNEYYRFVTTPVATPDLIVVPSAKHGPVVGVKPDARGLVEPGSPYELWCQSKLTPDVPSPLVHDGLVYLCGELGVLSCLDAKTGKELYQQRLRNSRYRASPVYADGKVYFTARDAGTVSVVKAGPKFELLAVNRLPDQFAASPAIADGRIYLRGFKALYAIGTK